MKSQNILIINSTKNISQPLACLFHELRLKGHFFYLFSKGKTKEDNLFVLAKKKYFGPQFNNNINLILFFILYPFLSFYYFFQLLLIKKKSKIEVIILLNWNEKIIFTPLSFVLKLKVIWLEYPEINLKLIPGLSLFFYKLYSRGAKIISFLSITKIQYEQMKFNNNAAVIPLGIKINEPEHQDTIFSSLAKSEQSYFSQKYFTIGTVVDLNQANQAETLFKAIKKCLEVINNLQVIIIGDGLEKKNLSWLAKKMEINNIVWFVGKQAYLKKWLDSFDVYVITSEEVKLLDLDAVLRAMAQGLPVVGPRNKGYEDLVVNGKIGFLIESGNSEVLAQQIIGLYKDKHLCRNLGKNAREIVDKNYRIDKMAKRFEEVIS
ncbi:MAG: glycosyltransferase family 4 protein [Patescibacteria group bacterium]